MATSYPDRTNARGIWRISEITRNIKTEGTFPDAGSGIGLLAAGTTGSDSNVIQQITISTTGDATDFGDLSVASQDETGAGNFTRAVFVGAETIGVQTYVHFASKGNSANFGNLSSLRRHGMKVANNIKHVTGGGYISSELNVIDENNFATLGTATDFGDLTTSRAQGAKNINSPTRGIWAGGFPSNSNVIDYIEFSTTGNATDFGDLTTGAAGYSGCSSSTRGVMGGGESPTILQNIDTLQIASQANTTDFGDMTVARGYGDGVSNSQRGVFCGGYSNPAVHNQMDYVSFASAGNATDFGDLVEAASDQGGASNHHGGLDVFDPRAPELYSPTGRPLASGGGVGDIGLFAGGEYNYTNIVDFITISSTGNAVDFGDTNASLSATSGAGSAIRGFTGGGQPGLSDQINYKEFRSKGNFADFGNLTVARDKLASVSNSTRAVWAGGRGQTSSPEAIKNEIDYVTMATLGNASDFGDLSAVRQGTQGLSNTTRGVYGGGKTPSYVDIVEYITIASTSNTTDFGDLTVARAPIGGTGAASSTRGLFAGGEAPSNSDVIDYVTIASTGDANDFGDLAFVTGFASGLSNNVRAVFSGFNNTSAPGADSTFGNAIQISYVTIASTGNVNNFGDLTARRYGLAAASNGHGGLS